MWPIIRQIIRAGHGPRGQRPESGDKMMSNCRRQHDRKPRQYYSDVESSRCGTTLPAARRNQARKIYHDEFEVSPGIGNEIGNAANTPSMAKQPAITNRAILGAYNFIVTTSGCNPSDLGTRLRRQFLRFKNKLAVNDAIAIKLMWLRAAR